MADPKFGNILLAKFANSLMVDGKKSVAERAIYGALDLIGDKSGKEPISIFKDAIENVRPQIETS